MKYATKKKTHTHTMYKEVVDYCFQKASVKYHIYEESHIQPHSTIKEATMLLDLDETKLLTDYLVVGFTISDGHSHYSQIVICNFNVLLNKLNKKKGKKKKKLTAMEQISCGAFCFLIPI